MSAAFDVTALRQELEESLEGEARFDSLSRALYATDASVYQIEPIGVVLPKSRDDLVRVVQACRRHGCSITMRGGGTSQAGQAIGPGLVVDISKYFNRLLEVNVAERWARVEPGIVLDQLNAALAPHRLRFAPDVSTASRATLGGMMANNSAGARSVIYGKTIDHVIEQQVLLSDGTVAWFRPVAGDDLDRLCTGATLEASCYREVRRLAREHAEEIDRRFPKVLRRVGGYNLDEFVNDRRPFNLAKLMVGSEGTLGIVVEARINLVPLPAAKAVLVIQFGDLLESLAATPVILQHQPAAVEVMDAFILDHTEQSPDLHRLRQTFVDGQPASLLCVEFYGDRAEDLPPRIDALERDLAARHFGTRYHRATDPAAQQSIWLVREAALGLAMATKGDAKAVSFVEDTAVAPERLRDYIRDFLAIARRHGTEAGVYAHASVGCLHVRPVVNLKTAEGVREFEAIASEVADLVLAYGGALSGEHGDGLVRSPFMERMFGPVLYDAFRQIKRTFDPDGLFNPGKIVDAPPLASNLRYGPAYRAAPVATFFDYDAYGGLAGAVEMCSGLGACRKTESGTMCPSFMATRDEAHSTRGRANALRLALSGKLGDAGLSDDAVHEVLDLCLECRACKTECPVGVDVARMKSEFLAAYWRRRGRPARARVLGQIDRVARWGSRLAPASNVISRSALGRGLTERLLGLDRRRTPPAWVRRTFRDQFVSPHPERPDRVAIFVDTFTNHQHPSIGLAALDVIGRLGFGVTLAPNLCCGRPLISQGLLDEAQRRARDNAERLLPLAEAGRTLVFLEPSCLSAVREDAPDLLSGEARRMALAVAGRAKLFEEWLEAECRDDRARLSLTPGPATVMLHGHCHQKSMNALAPAKALLSRIPGAKIVDPDAGCCGMAGSFGYMREHFDVSRDIGEHRLFPAARTLGANAVLVASGTSCRQQIADFTGVRAVHAAQLIRSLMTSPA
ncbi:MAG TPA: FAD-linked oxidase C-terminal domain-containing protein [Vicinamibacterales bacterium]|nr:FAD-linked oxidase C-terminal domain-containing protein [Vicinamibacterales bacterium]